MRQEINDRASNTIEKLISGDPELQNTIDTSAGYFVGRISGAKGPFIGAGKGIGVLYDRERSTRTYMDINRFDFGLGLGTGAYSVLAEFEEKGQLERFKSGKWMRGLGAESAAGDKAAMSVSQIDEEISFFIIPETGGGLTATARAVKISVNEDLTDTGISEVSLPNTGFTKGDRQGEDAPRRWEHKLPLMAQKVIDLGYDLPLPYGIGLTFANVNQEMLLDELEVGINGNDKEPFQFVSFENANALSNSLQIKLDAWIFPFMNVFGLIGKVEGRAPLDVILDGNDMLDHMGVNCGGPPNPQCGLLEDKTFTLPIDAPFSGTTYGVGTVLAGGWNNWFVALPMSFTYADMDTTETEGLATTVTPRFGRVMNAGKWGNFALYSGGNYLDADLKVTGQVSTPDNLLVIDYTIEQENTDKWNLLLGGAWDINKRWSCSAEYNGFIGSREAIILSVSRRF